MSDPMVTFGALIRDRRKARNWSLRDLAGRTGISYGHLSMAERGKIGVSLAAAVRIATVLDIDLGALTGEKPCDVCHGSPPDGFACKQCGLGGE